MGNRIVFDTGPVLAALNPADTEHRRCASWLATYRGRRFLPSPVMAEVCWNLESRPDIEANFVASVTRGTFTLVNLEKSHLERIRELIATSGDWPLGAIDASVVAVAEALRISDVATLDHNHFRTIRPAHTKWFTLHP